MGENSLQKNYSSHHRILRARRVKQCRVQTEDPQILGDIVQYLVATETWRPGICAPLKKMSKFSKIKNGRNCIYLVKCKKGFYWSKDEVKSDRRHTLNISGICKEICIMSVLVHGMSFEHFAVNNPSSFAHGILLISSLIMLTGSLFLELLFSVGYGLVDIVVCTIFGSEWMNHSQPCRSASKSEQLSNNSSTSVKHM
jgi:hypothetical protein